jgi:hypothetical protein
MWLWQKTWGMNMQSLKLVQVKIGESHAPGLHKKSISFSECSKFNRNQLVRRIVGAAAAYRLRQ